MTEVLGDLDDRVGGDPARNADHKGVKAFLLQCFYRVLYLNLLVVVGYGEYGNQIKSLGLKSLLCGGALSDNDVDGGAL